MNPRQRPSCALSSPRPYTLVVHGLVSLTVRRGPCRRWQASPTWIPSANHLTSPPRPSSASSPSPSPSTSLSPIIFSLPHTYSPSPRPSVHSYVLTLPAEWRFYRSQRSWRLSPGCILFIAIRSVLSFLFTPMHFPHTRPAARQLLQRGCITSQQHRLLWPFFHARGLQAVLHGPSRLQRCDLLCLASTSGCAH